MMRKRLLPLGVTLLLLLGGVVWLTRSTPTAESDLTQAEASLDAGDPAEAERIAIDALNRHPDDPRFERIRGIALMRQERYDESIVHHLRAAALTPDNPATLLDLGVAMMAANRHSEAVPHLRRLTQIAPSAEGFVTLGMAQEQSRDYDGALVAYRKALTLATVGSRRHKAAQTAIDRVANRGAP